MANRSTPYYYCKYSIMIAAAGFLGISGCNEASEMDADVGVGSGTHALGVEDDCPAGTSYDFSYGNAKLLLCSHKDIFAENSNVKRAIIAIRGSGWTTCGYECYYQNTYNEAVAAGMDLDKLDIIAPRLLRHSICEEDKGKKVCSLYKKSCISDSDCQPAGYYRWGNSYIGGGQDRTEHDVSSYELLDALLFHLAVKRPNLETIVVAGQSQGGQFVGRYAPSSALSSGGGITIRYWSANPGSYTWLNGDSRPDPAEAEECSDGANNWRYGLDNLYPYHTKRNYGANVLKHRTFTREIFWTTGENDKKDYDENAHCANAQGKYRIDRFRNYKQHTYEECVAQGYQHCASFTNNQFFEVPGCEHGVTCSWKSPIGHKILFGTVHNICSELAVDHQTFGAHMVGCAGNVSYANRDTLCGPGYSACSAYQWVNFRNGRKPEYNYWTSDALKYGPSGGSEGNCWVDETVGFSCPSSTPMRVCTENIPGLPTGTDSLGNTCNWDHCGYQGSTENEFFGGCIGDTTAGTLCCPVPQ